MNILFITSEAEPFCKTGGLADVAGSLPVALAASGQRTAVLLPLYDTIAQSWRDQMTRVWEGTPTSRGVTSPAPCGSLSGAA